MIVIRLKWIYWMKEVSQYFLFVQYFLYFNYIFSGVRSVTWWRFVLNYLYGATPNISHFQKKTLSLTINNFPPSHSDISGNGTVNQLAKTIILLSPPNHETLFHTSIKTIWRKWWSLRRKNSNSHKHHSNKL